MADTAAAMNGGHIRTESLGHTITAIGLAFGILTVWVISMRMFARIYIIRAVGWDDLLMIIAALLSWAFIVATIMSIQHGLGSHIENVMQRGPENLVAYAKIVWLSSIFYNATLGFIKTSVLALYSRLGDRQLRTMAFCMMAVVSCQAMANVFTCIFQCNPIQAAWITTLPGAKCVNINAFYLANAALNIATDLLTYLLPLRLVYHLQLPNKQKVILCVMLCLGLFACVSSIIRITFIPRMLTDPDSTWAISGAMYWSIIETNIGILAASIPSFKPIAKRYLPRIVGEYSSRDGGVTSGLASASRTRSPFRKLGDHVIMKPMKSRKDGVITNISAVDGSREGDVNTVGKKGVETHIEHRNSSTSSEERIMAPRGQIVTQTQITRYVEDSGDNASLWHADGGNHANSDPYGPEKV